MFIDVLRVESHAIDDEVLRGFAVDLPTPGTSIEGLEVEIAGWVLGRRRVRSLEFSSGGQVLTRTRLNALRPDLALAFPDAAGAEKAGFRALVPMPSTASAEVALDAVMDRRRVHLGIISLRRRWRHSRDELLQRLMSIVVPCYNQAHFLPDALESVLAQSYPHIEVIVVDDGSTDNTAAVVSRYPTVGYIRQENAGAAAARNTGLRMTNGDMLTFLDADDTLASHAVAVGVEARQEHPAAAFAFGYASMALGEGAEPEEPYQPLFDNDYYSRLLAGCPIVSIASVTYRRSAFQAVGPFDPSLRHLEDYDLYYRIARSYPIHCHGHTVAVYRRHGGNATGSGGAVALRDARAVLRRQASWVKDDPSLRDAHRRGRRYWGGHLGGVLARQVQADIGEHRWLSAGRGLLALLRWWPRGLATVARSPRRITDLPEWRPETWR